MGNIINWDKEKGCVVDVIPVEQEAQSICLTEPVSAEPEKVIEDKKVYLAQDIQNLLGIGRSRCYTYLEEVYKKQEPFRVIKIGKLFCIPKQYFGNWLNGCA